MFCRLPAAKAQQSLPLYQEVERADSAMFHAFNTCDSDTYKNFTAPDLEFYHDLGGLSVGRDVEMKSFREMCQRGTHIRRELIKNSLEVYSIKNYGAIEIGVHRFYHTNPGQPERVSGTYKFIHVWHRTQNGWQLARVISYAHDHVNNN
jgi:ketosteroid isomerase-like protein